MPSLMIGASGCELLEGRYPTADFRKEIARLQFLVVLVYMRHGAPSIDDSEPTQQAADGTLIRPSNARNFRIRAVA